ncbi:MAG: AMP-binding protein [Actinobacteria bacterium]|nr:AMP-binding protein [Actinomycetota bacterium]
MTGEAASPTTVEAAEPTVDALLLAHRDDERVGLRFEDQRWTWAECVQAAADRAAWLASVRRPGPFHLGVLLENTPDFAFLLGAAALSGAVLVGLNPTLGAADLADAVARTECQLVVTESRHRARLDGLALASKADRIVEVDGAAHRAALARHAGAPVPSQPSAAPGDLFMLIFTSGTSGRPKAVRVTNRKVAVPGVMLAERFGLGPGDVCYLSMPLFHSNAVLAGWAPALAAGATMALARRFSASGFLPDVRRYGATYANYVGKPLSYVLATPERPDDADNPLRIVFGNEAAGRDIARFGARFGCIVVDGFGSTENGVVVSRTPDAPTGSLGVPAPGVAVVDPVSRRPCPPARFGPDGTLENADEAIGELVNTAGAGQFEGYYGDEEADRERLRDGWYWSGDLAYTDADGFVWFAGRTAERLRVDGENLAAAQIERVLLRLPGVVLTAVYAVPAADTGDEVMAALVLAPGAAFDPGAFATFLAEQPDLGAKGAPRFVRVAESLPQTETNKVLKRVLAAERWSCSDPVWWRPGRDLVYTRLGPDDAQRLDRALQRDGGVDGRSRLHVRPAPKENAWT